MAGNDRFFQRLFLVYRQVLYRSFEKSSACPNQSKSPGRDVEIFHQGRRHAVRLAKIYRIFWAQGHASAALDSPGGKGFPGFHYTCMFRHGKGLLIFRLAANGVKGRRSVSVFLEWLWWFLP
ncbi:MAG: hypothetical protein U1D30_10375 [Planctomycetota bacterium]